MVEQSPQLRSLGDVASALGSSVPSLGLPAKRNLVADAAIAAYPAGQESWIEGVAGSGKTTIVRHALGTSQQAS